MFDSNVELAIAVAAGLMSHWAFFVHGERDLIAARVAGLHIIAFILIALAKTVLGDLVLRQVIRETAAIGGTYVVALFSSIAVYRTLLSPIRHIPGPLRLRLTKLTHMWDMARYQNCKVLHELQRDYGDIIRTGRT